MAQVLQFGQRNRSELKTGKGLNQGCQKIQKSVGNKETKHLQVDWPFAKNWVESKNITEKHTISFRSMGGWLGWKCGISQKLSNILTPLTSPRSTLNILVIFYWNFLLGGSHLWPLSVNMSTSIIWCDSNKKVQYFSVWLWYTLCSPLMAYHHNDRLCEKVSWLLPNHIPIKLLFLFSTQLN